MYFTRLAIITVRQDSKDSLEVIVERTEFATPSNASSTKRKAQQYHEKLADAISLITE
jgi:hypothetical protein